MKRNRVILWSLMLSHLLLYSNEVPNEKVVENPERKVGTIESKKLRDRAKLSLEINKIASKKLNGRLVGSEIKVSLPVVVEKDTKIKVESQKKITLPKIANIRSRFLAQEEMENIVSERVEKNSENYALSENGKELSIQNGREDRNYYVTLDGNDGKSTVYEISDVARTLEGTEDGSTADTAIDIGEVVFVVDKRIQFRELNSNQKHKYDWIFADGTKLEGFGGYPIGKKRYDDFILVKGNFNTSEDVSSDVKIAQDEITVTGLTKSENYAKAKYNVFRVDVNQWYNAFAFPYDISLNELRSKLVISKDNQNNNDENGTGRLNKFKFKTSNNKYYSGRVKEVYIDNKSVMGEAEIDLSVIDAGEELYFFEPGVEESITDSNGALTLIMKKGFSLDSRAPDLLSRTIPTHTHPKRDKRAANVFRVNDGNWSPTKIFKSGPIVAPKIDGKVQVGLSSIGGLAIGKLKNESFEKEIEIESWYDPDIGNSGVTAISQEAGVRLSNLKLKVINKVEELPTITFKIDERLKQRKIDAGKWLNSNGEIKNENGDKVEDISKYVKVEMSNTQEAKSRIITDDMVTKVVEIAGKSELSDKKLNDTLSYRTEGSSGKIALPYGTGVKLENYSYKSESKNNFLPYISIEELKSTLSSTSDKEENNFIVRTMGKQYKGKIVKEYVKVREEKTSGRVDLTEIPVGNTVYEFSPTTSSEARSSNGNLVITEIDKGILDGRGINGDVIANKFTVEKVDKSNGESKATSDSSLTAKLENLTFGISNEHGGLTLVKNGISNLKKVKITYYHEPKEINTREISSNAVKLGEFELEIQDIIDLGEAKFKIDGRLASQKNNYWFFGNGGLLKGIDNSTDEIKYPMAVKVDGFNNEIMLPLRDELITEITSIVIGNNNSTISETEKKKEYFGVEYQGYKSSSNYATNIFFPLNISITELEEKLVYLTNSSSFPNNSYTFKVRTNTGRVYQGKVTKSIESLYSKVDGIATLDLTNIPKNSQGTWSSESGKVEKSSISGLFDLKFTKDYLLNMSSVNSPQVTTDIAYKNPNKSGTEVLSSKKLLDLDLNNNGTIDIRMEFINEGMRITKLTNEKIETRQILITPKYNEVSLGDLTLTLTNTPRELGEIIFEIDSRMKNVANGEWLMSNGELKSESGETYAKYGDMVTIFRKSLESGISNRKYNREKVIFIESIGDKYDDFVETEINNIRYKTQKDNPWIALPESSETKEINIGDYDSGIGNLIAIKKDKPTSTETFTSGTDTSQEFTVTAKESENSEPLYKGKITKKYVGKESYSGVGVIDITNLRADGTEYIFEPEEQNFTKSEIDSGARYIASKDRRIAISVTGDFVDTRGVVGIKKGQNIANKIKVEKLNEEKTLTETVAISENGELSVTLDNITFGIDEASGGLSISKNNNTKLKKVKISYYYMPEEVIQTRSITEKDILLGEFTLNIEDLDVEIDGDGTLDFGNLAYTEEHKKQTREERYRIKNLDNKKVSFGVAQTSGEMHLVTDGTPKGTKEEEKNSKIPLTNIAVEQVDNKTFDLQATAEITPETKEGNYSGEIEVTVTLDEK